MGESDTLPQVYMQEKHDILILTWGPTKWWLLESSFDSKLGHTSNLCNNHPYTHTQENDIYVSKILASLIIICISHDLTICYSLSFSTTRENLRYYLKMSKCPSLSAKAPDISCVGPIPFTEAMLRVVLTKRRPNRLLSIYNAKFQALRQ